MKITKEDLGKKFNLADGTIAKVIVHASYESVISWGSKLDNYTSFIALVDNESGACGEDEEFSIASRHEPRAWLKDMPSFGEIKDGWIARDERGAWYWYDEPPILSDRHWDSSSKCQRLSCAFTLPELTGDQWKGSLISTVELKRWQSGNKQASQA